jgi:serine/threonine protein kinase/Tol biopolymer transport system component
MADPNHVRDVFEQALRRDPSERAALLEAACGHDEELHAEVDRLLAAHARVAPLFDTRGAQTTMASGSPHSGAMALSAGVRVGCYDITGVLGAGGMGEVYRARDTKLNRDVALKVLPEVFAGDPHRLARLGREAQLLGALNHKNIAAIYGFEDSSGVQALVLELVEGQTLAERIAKGRVPLDEALPIARQIADALEAAHESGIIHRDLKPANIKLRPDGTVKVLDFGLAKALESTVIAPDVSASPTIAGPALTHEGMILGTAPYMSPEQTRGRPADKRSDVWAFGCVLFEMITGRRAFGGTDVSETIAEVLKSEPAWASLPPDTPPVLRRLLRRCLTKEPRQRLPEMGTARLDIEEILHPSNDTTDSRSERWPRGRVRFASMAAGAVLLIITVMVGTVAYRTRQPESPAFASEIRVEIAMPPGVLATFALSPDGTKIVYAAGGQLWLRALASEVPQRLTEGGNAPFWSPDSQSIGFFWDGQLKRLDLSSGLVQVLANAPLGMGGSWSKDGTILFVPSHSSPVSGISAGGGDAAKVSRLTTGHVGHRFPQFLPDGRHFIYFATGTLEARGVYAGSLDSPDAHRLFEGDSPATFAPPDSLLFMRGGALLAQRIDLVSLTLRGEVVPVAPQVVLAATSYNALAVTASSVGRLAFRSHGGRRQLTWADRMGRRVAMLGEADDVTPPYAARLSPDGRALSVDRTAEGDTDVWVIDTDRGTKLRLTHEPVREAAGVWSPDGRTIAFASERTGLFGIYTKLADGSGGETLVSSSSAPRIPTDWSPNGRFLIFLQQSVQGGNSLWILPLTGNQTPTALDPAPTQQDRGRFSPDSHWIAYESRENTARTAEVYVRRFPGPSGAIQISTNGGSFPIWRHDGRELFYIAPGNQVRSVSLRLGADTAAAGPSTPLFELGSRRLLDISADGQRFLLHEETEPPAPITLVLNWAGPHR